MSEDFKIWWHREGSGMPPLKGEDTCEHVERVSAIAWSNGAYKATEALKAENARLKTEVQHLMVFCNCTLIPNKELQAQVERLTKAVMHSPAAQLKLKELEGKTTFEEINPDNQ